MTNNFYRAFEEKHRGSRQLIKERLRVYLPFIAVLPGLYEGAQAIDLGCGRGEWLELLTENGFDVRGVDLDDGMLMACRELGLKVETKDALAALQELPDASQTIVSGFHIAEHLPFEKLHALVQQAHRVLKPAGLLILETPNPENIIVGTSGFYTDPTHQRPLPPALLEFLPEYSGFGRIKTIRLQEERQLATKSQLDLMDILGGSSPDYAVVAQKSADPELLAVAAAAFEQDYGLPLGLLASRYDQQQREQLDEALKVARDARTHADHVEQLSRDRTQQIADVARTNAALTGGLQHAIKNAEEAQAALNDGVQHALTTANEALAQAMEAKACATQTQAALHAVMHSRSWRLTAPLRWVGQQARRLRDEGFVSRVGALGRKIARPVLRRSIRLLEARPELRRRCVALAHKFGLYHSLRSLYLRLSRQAPAAPTSVSQEAASGETHPPLNEESSQLSERVKGIYSDLKAEIAARNHKVGQ